MPPVPAVRGDRLIKALEHAGFALRPVHWPAWLRAGRATRARRRLFRQWRIQAVRPVIVPSWSRIGLATLTINDKTGSLRDSESVSGTVG